MARLQGPAKGGAAQHRLDGAWCLLRLPQSDEPHDSARSDAHSRRKELQVGALGLSDLDERHSECCEFERRAGGSVGGLCDHAPQSRFIQPSLNGMNYSLIFAQLLFYWPDVLQDNCASAVDGGLIEGCSQSSVNTGYSLGLEHLSTG